MKNEKVKRQKAKVRKALRISFLTFAFLLLPFAFLACGKRRPPLPPVERVAQRTEGLTGSQRGNLVILTWPAPQRNAKDQSVQSIRRIDVYRLAENLSAPLPLTEEEFAARSTLVGSVTYPSIQAATDTLIYVDTLELAGQPTRLRYALRYVNAAGQRAAFSNFFLIEPAAGIAEPPALISPAELSEKAVTIRWRPPATNIDGSAPVNLLGYNIYRTEKAELTSDQAPLNKAPVTATEYADTAFQFGTQYTYVVRSVSLGTGGAQVESLNSNSVTVAPKDIYPPSAPTGLSIAPAPGRISIFFAANPERDVAGYNLYRSTDPNLPKKSWTKLNAQLLTRTTYQDEAVESGKKYYYYLTAVDTAGNESAPSDVVSETVP